ncbi:penicillin-binding transpeptidase domain-containing protein [Pseudomonas lundensis]|uniref:penicillin-binding transpeptidase domain-containing protein n=1 Tax=Pseudomonas lundensis TaxID=86185 RepID=UPI0030BA1A66
MPSFNPNARRSFDAKFFRNRVFADVYEPGSVIKPFSMAAVLTANVIDKNAIIKIAPGFVKINGYTIRDVGRDRAVSRSKCNTSCKVLPCLPNTTT